MLDLDTTSAVLPIRHSGPVILGRFIAPRMTHIIPAKSKRKNRYIGNTCPKGRNQNTGTPAMGNNITRSIRIMANPSFLPNSTCSGGHAVEFDNVGYASGTLLHSLMK